MSTIIKAKTKAGRLLICGRSCYDANRPKCNCICGGLNHGRGYQTALRNNVHHLRQLRTAISLKADDISDVQFTIALEQTFSKTFRPEEETDPCPATTCNSPGASDNLPRRP